jgi:triacylglycerol lipase
MMYRRHLVSLCLTAVLAACAAAPTSTSSSTSSNTPSTTFGPSMPPIVFVHGNGDSAALWQTTLWRFESNGWPRSHLHAIDVPYPLARDDDSKPQAGRTSTTEHMAYLKAEVERIMTKTGAKQVVLLGNSRGGNAIRNYIQNGGGDKTVSHAVLGGTPNHGVWAIKGFREGNEFAGTGPFLTALNAPKNVADDEVLPSITVNWQTQGIVTNQQTHSLRWATIRSDNNDKFAQPDGVWIGQKGTPTNVTFAGPELKGATNIVIPRIDHRETSFSPAAFDATYRFITGQAPKTLDITAEARMVLNGQVTGLGIKSDDPASGNFVNNLPISNAMIEIYAVDAATGVRVGETVHRKTVAADGQWGPFVAHANTAYEFVVSAPGYATTHIYRSPFARSSSVIHLRAERIADADKDAVTGQGSIVTMTRPRGYFDVQRDAMVFDGQIPPPGLPAGGAGLSVSKIKYTNVPQRAIAAVFNGETVTGRPWPAAGGHVVVLEITQ